MKSPTFLEGQYVKLLTDFCAIYGVQKIREKNPPDVTAANEDSNGNHE